MECLIGLRFNDFVLLAADTIDARSIVVMKHGKFLVLVGCERENFTCHVHVPFCTYLCEVELLENKTDGGWKSHDLDN